MAIISPARSVTLAADEGRCTGELGIDLALVHVEQRLDAVRVHLRGALQSNSSHRNTSQYTVLGHDSISVRATHTRVMGCMHHTRKMNLEK